MPSAVMGGYGGSSLPVSDSTSIAEDNTDGTKEVRFELSGLTTGQTRVITVPDSNTTLPVTSQVVTVSGPTAARTYTFPDANATIARTDAGQTFTGNQTFSVVDTPTITPAAHVVEQYNGTNAQTLRVYNTRTDASNYERGFARWSSNVFEVGAESAGTGLSRVTTLRAPGNVQVTTASTTLIFAQSSGAIDLNQLAGSIRMYANGNSGNVLLRSPLVLGDGSTGGVLVGVSASPTQLAGDTNNWNPGRNLNLRASSDATRNVTGISNSQTDGQMHYLWNVGSQNLVLVNESASSTAANRFTNSTGADITLAPNKCAFLFYDGTASRWRVTLLP